MRKERGEGLTRLRARIRTWFGVEGRSWWDLRGSGSGGGRMTLLMRWMGGERKKCRRTGVSFWVKDERKERKERKKKELGEEKISIYSYFTRKTKKPAPFTFIKIIK